MAGSRVDLVDTLSPTQRHIMFLISRNKKKRPSNTFSDADLVRKLQHRGIDPIPLLEELQGLGIVQAVDRGKHLWAVVDNVVEHECARRELEQKYGFRIERR